MRNKSSEWDGFGPCLLFVHIIQYTPNKRTSIPRVM